ncbi:hypothetical protein DFJ74DRAFT_662194 [Hyaloraphidium curvatum]|nr:hypothetical protein DFJ74DRAFT_662194 [Hyaloraphidium curvatum]
MVFNEGLNRSMVGAKPMPEARWDGASRPGLFPGADDDGGASTFRTAAASATFHTATTLTTAAGAVSPARLVPLTSIVPRRPPGVALPVPAEESIVDSASTGWATAAPGGAFTFATTAFRLSDQHAPIDFQARHRASQAASSDYGPSLEYGPELEGLFETQNLAPRGEPSSPPPILSQVPVHFVERTPPSRTPVRVWQMPKRTSSGAPKTQSSRVIPSSPKSRAGDADIVDCMFSSVPLKLVADVESASQASVVPEAKSCAAVASQLADDSLKQTCSPAASSRMEPGQQPQDREPWSPQHSLPQLQEEDPAPFPDSDAESGRIPGLRDLMTNGLSQEDMPNPSSSVLIMPVLDVSQDVVPDSLPPRHFSRAALPPPIADHCTPGGVKSAAASGPSSAATPVTPAVGTGIHTVPLGSQIEDGWSAVFEAHNMVPPSIEDDDGAGSVAGLPPWWGDRLLSDKLDPADRRRRSSPPRLCAWDVDMHVPSSDPEENFVPETQFTAPPGRVAVLPAEPNSDAAWERLPRHRWLQPRHDIELIVEIEVDEVKRTWKGSKRRRSGADRSQLGIAKSRTRETQASLPSNSGQRRSTRSRTSASQSQAKRRRISSCPKIRQ